MIARLEPILTIVGQEKDPNFPYTIDLCATPRDPDSHYRWDATAEEAKKIASVRDAILGAHPKPPLQENRPMIKSWDPVDLMGEEPF
jgi:hypothetical protein